MNKNEFIDRLAGLLADISPEEKEEALAYYREYIEDAGAENEEAVLQELGSPEEIAAAIKEDPAYKASRQSLAPVLAPTAASQQEQYYQQTATASGAASKDNSSTTLILAIVLTVVLSPVWFPLISGILAALAGILIGALFGGIGCMLAGVGLLIAAIVCLFKSTLLIAFSLLGAALLVAAIGILLMLLGVWLCATVFPWCIKGLASLFRRLFSQNKEANA